MRKLRISSYFREGLWTVYPSKDPSIQESFWQSENQFIHQNFSEKGLIDPYFLVIPLRTIRSDYCSIVDIVFTTVNICTLLIIHYVQGKMAIKTGVYNPRPVFIIPGILSHLLCGNCLTIILKVLSGATKSDLKKIMAIFAVLSVTWLRRIWNVGI